MGRRFESCRAHHYFLEDRSFTSRGAWLLSGRMSENWLQNPPLVTADGVPKLGVWCGHKIGHKLGQANPTPPAMLVSTPAPTRGPGSGGGGSFQASPFAISKSSQNFFRFFVGGDQCWPALVFCPLFWDSRIVCRRVVLAKDPAAARPCFNLRHSLTDRSFSLVCRPDSTWLSPASTALAGAGGTR
jgi:hypothetical protein